MRIRGQFYPVGSSRSQDSYLEVEDSGLVYLRCTMSGKSTPQGRFEDLGISSRVGNSARSLRFIDGGLFESTENDQIDKALKQYQKSDRLSLIHSIESRYSYVFASALLMVGFIWFLVAIVVPYSAQKVAMSLPAPLAMSVGQGTLDVLDQVFLEPSKLEKTIQDRLTVSFQAMAAQSDQEIPLKLIFRSSPEVGANAFALPDGTIILTDELVNLSENDAQLEAVLTHEIGHVVGRHSLRRVLQQTGLSVLLIVVTGDITSVANLAAALPALLMESSYSRDMESEADQFALSFMKTHGPEPYHFAEIMRLLKSEHAGESSDLSMFLSTHPDSDERINPFIAEH
ncbi:M48 family metallopeptidase [Endozoicomonas numazuensis]|uniref:M48 family metallopeptidase n=1 Tax=Endozoicomonas numazuensis TaxID=1137799 RepID=UPI0006917A6E|nr:M48 family metallopeptidase [Endozoicomonas numazuensis]